MRIVEMRGGYLYQHCPDLFPQGLLTDAEVALWAAYFERQAAQRKAANGNP